jgi:hypothetical protein
LVAPTVNPPPSEDKANLPASVAKPARPSLHYTLVITLYRIFAVTVLYLVLAGILAYAFVMGFYSVNTSWAAPVILSAADEKSLDFREKLVTSQQTIEDLKVDSRKLQDGLTEMKSIAARCSNSSRNSRTPSRGNGRTIAPPARNSRHSTSKSRPIT